jgi:hypothetical protein
MPENIKNEEKIELEKKKNEFDFDELKMFFREPHLIRMENGEFIEILQPSIGDILVLGDREVYSAISPFVNNTTSYRVQLWDIGIDWNKISDYELFTTLVTHVNDVSFLCKRVYFIENEDYNERISEQENLKNGNERYIKVSQDIDFSKLAPYTKTDENQENEKARQGTADRHLCSGGVRHPVQCCGNIF